MLIFLYLMNVLLQYFRVCLHIFRLVYIFNHTVPWEQGYISTIIFQHYSNILDKIVELVYWNYLEFPHLSQILLLHLLLNENYMTRVHILLDSFRLSHIKNYLITIQKIVIWHLEWVFVYLETRNRYMGYVWGNLAFSS